MVLKTSGCGEVKTNWGFVFPTLSMRDTEKTLISQDLLQFRLVLGFFLWYRSIAEGWCSNQLVPRGNLVAFGGQ